MEKIKNASQVSWWNDKDQKTSYIYAKFSDQWKNSLEPVPSYDKPSQNEIDYSMHTQEKTFVENIKSYASTVLKGVQEITPLSFYFFSQKNIQNIQNLLRKSIYDISEKKYIIDNQDEDELLIIMRSIFLEYAINQSQNITNQIRCLNNRVVEIISPQVFSAVDLYHQYLKDAFQPYKTMDRPRFESMAGTKSFDLSRFL
jgi:hypothetical protein